MDLRSVLGILIVVGSLALLLVTGALTAESSRPWKVGSLIAVVAVYSSLLWVRDRYFPARESATQEGGPIPLLQKVGKPWLLLVASFASTALPLMIFVRSGIALDPSEATRLAFRITAWGVLAPAIALMIARLPISKSAPIFDWWLPGGLLVLLSVLSSRLFPDLVLLIAKQADAESPNVATLLIAPIAAFVWRSLQFVRKNPIH